LVNEIWGTGNLIPLGPRRIGRKARRRLALIHFGTDRQHFFMSALVRAHTQEKICLGSGPASNSGHQLSMRSENAGVTTLPSAQSRLRPRALTRRPRRKAEDKKEFIRKIFHQPEI